MSQAFLYLSLIVPTVIGLAQVLLKQFFRKTGNGLGFICGTSTHMILVLLMVSHVLSSQVIEIPAILVRVTSMNLAGLMAASLIFLLVSIYSLKFDNIGRLHPRTREFFMLLLLCGITGLLCAYDLFTTFFFLELVSGCCVMLVIDTRDKAASSAAFKYAIMLAISSFFYLLGLSVVYNLTGTTNVLRILDTPALITILNEHSRSFMFAVACFLITFFVKIGLIPFHGWLPDVYVTANPVVICSFSAKSIALFYSFYSLIQPFSILHQFTTIIALIVMFGMISMFFGVLIAFAQKDFMRMLAYCQIYLSGLAACTLFLANPTSPEPGMNFLSGMYYIVNGALMKTGMILILHPAYLSNHTRNMEFLGGFIEKKRILAICYVICIFSLAGIPPTSGFFAKWLVYNTLYATMVPVGGQAAGIAMLIFLACMATVEIVVLLRSFHRIFLGKPHRKMMDVHVYAGMWGPPVVLTAIAIILGFQPSLLLAMLGAG